MASAIPSRGPLPFENRWTSSRHGWEWFDALEALGVEQVRESLLLGAAGHPTDLDALHVPAGYVRAWLAFHRHRERQADRRWKRALLVVALLAAGAASAAALLAALTLGRVPS